MMRRIAKKSRKGYILIAFTLSIPVAFGMVGLATDLGRMYIAKNEAQSFVDAMAITAALNLNGDRSGLTAAENAVRAGALQGAKRWHLGTNLFSPNSVPSTASDTTQVTFSTTPADPANPATTVSWTYSAGVPNGKSPISGGPPNPVNTNLAKVATSVQVPLYILPILVGSQTSRVSAAATAVRSPATSYAANTNVVPFSPISHKAANIDIDDPDDPFGFQIGQYYTLLWDKHGKTKSTTCPGDDSAAMEAFANDGKNGDIGGWLGQVCQGASVCKDALNGDGLTYDVDTGPLEFDSKEGNVTSIVHASDARVSTDDQSQSYFGDNGYAANRSGRVNGRRFVFAPVNSGIVTGGTGNNSQFTVVGFGAFLLMKSSGGVICGQYLGTGVAGQPFSGGVPAGSDPVGNAAFSVRLVQ